MITITQTRKQIGNNDWCYDFGGLHERTPAKALEQLMLFELGYGATITELDFPTKITVETCLGGKIDTMTCEGTKDEMLPLFKAVYAFSKTVAEHNEDLVKAAIRKLNQYGEQAFVPLVLSVLGPIAKNEELAKAAFMIGMGITTEEDIKKGIRLPTKDLVTVFELRESNPTMSFSELCAIAS